MKKLILKLFTLFFILSIPFVSASTISATNHSTYQLGDSNTKIYELKINLVKLGFADWNITDTSSIFDSATEEAVIEFQNYFEIEVTGKADEATFGKIKDVLSSPMQIGNSNVEIQEMKRNLTRLGFSNWNILNISPVFGAGTEEVVRRFQRYYGLKENGIIDEITLRKIEELLATPMKTGDRSLAVQKMKRDLTKIGITTWNINNVSTTFGSGTERAVKDFQKYYGLKVTGIVDRVTWKKIEEILYSPFQNGNSSAEIKEIKRNITRLGFSNWNILNISPVFGAGTEEAVRNFQRYYGLIENGITDEVTLRKIEELLETPMKTGDRSFAVQKMKRDLTRIGFTTWNINNISTTFGAGTERAVKDFQKYYGLPVTGVVDRVSRQKIEDILFSPMQNGNSSIAIQELKRDIVRLGFASWNINNVSPVFGVGTDATVRAVQSYYGLVVNGIADEVTLRKIEEILSSPMQSGNSSEEIRELKRNLSRVGITNWNIDHVSPTFGAGTEDAVRKFQRHYGLVENGIADSVTLRTIAEIISSPMQRGKSSADIQEMKRNLSRIGITNWNINSVSPTFGAGTEKAVRKFQRYYGLLENGIVDNSTLRKLDEILSSPLQRGNSSSTIKQIKIDLTTLGYANWNISNVSPTFGTGTEEVVKYFQRDNGLIVNGIVDSITLDKIKFLKENVVKIFLDPGHGGKDPGAVFNGLRESDVALDIALSAANTLRQRYKGVEVKMSRTTDVFVVLEDRAKLANEWGADYFVSIHTNGGGASGFETFIHNSTSTKEDIMRQGDIHTYLINKIGIFDRGMKRADFNVLRNSSMPSILIEYMFTDNRIENGKLQDPNYRRWLGEITAEAIAESFELKRR